VQVAVLELERQPFVVRQRAEQRAGVGHLFACAESIDLRAQPIAAFGVGDALGGQHRGGRPRELEARSDRLGPDRGALEEQPRGRPHEPGGPGLEAIDRAAHELGAVIHDLAGRPVAGVADGVVADRGVDAVELGGEVIEGPERERATGGGLGVGGLGEGYACGGQVAPLPAEVLACRHAT